MEIRRKLLHLGSIVSNFFIKVFWWAFFLTVIGIVFACVVAFPLQVIAFAVVSFLVIGFDLIWKGL